MNKELIDICYKKYSKEIDDSWDALAQKHSYITGEAFRCAFKRHRRLIGDLPTRKDYITEEINNKLSKLDFQMLEVKKEKYKIQTEKTEVSRWLRNQSKLELLQERIEKAISLLEVIKVPPLLSIKENYKVGITGLADIHFGKRILIRGVKDTIINQYDSEIFKKRLWHLLDKLIHIIKKENLSELYFFLLGDIIDGMIHINQLQNAEFGTIDSVIQFCEFISIWLNELSKYVRINLFTTLGNHSEIRPLHSKAGELANENMEKIIHYFISTRLQDNPNIIVQTCNKIAFVNICGLNVLAVHGHEEKSLEQSIKDYTMMYKERINLLLSAHLHTFSGKSIGMDVDYVQFDSICGSDDFSMKIHKTSNAGTKLLILENGVGKTTTYDINLQNVKNIK